MIEAWQKASPMNILVDEWNTKHGSRRMERKIGCVNSYLAVVNGNNNVANLYQTIPFGSSATHNSLHIHITI